MLGVFSAIDISASGLSAERTRMNTIASNLANARTTRTAEGGPYKRLDPVFQAAHLGGEAVGSPNESAVSLVKVQSIRQDTRDPQLVYEPGHPDADPKG